MINDLESEPALESGGRIFTRRTKGLVSPIEKYVFELSGVQPHETRANLIRDSIRMAPYNQLVSPNLIKTRGFLKIVSQIEGIARLNRWPIDSPEVKYISGISIQTQLANRIEWMEQQIGKLRTGERRYPTKAKTDSHLISEKWTLIELQEVNSEIEMNLEAYADENFIEGKINGKKYVEILQILARLSDYVLAYKRRGQVKKTMAEYLKKGKIDEAHNYLIVSLDEEFV